MSFRIRVLLAIGMALAGAAARPLAAQTRFGGQLSFASDANFGIGARVVADFASLVPRVRNVSLIGSLDYFFPGRSVTYFELNGNAVYRISVTGWRITPYVGGGLNIGHAGGARAGGSSSQVGLNLVGGTWFNRAGGVRPFLELRAELGGFGQFLVTGGMLF